MRKNIRWKLLAAFGLVLLCLVAMQFANYQNGKSLHQQGVGSVQAVESVQTVLSLQYALVLIETGQRGYFLTGDNDYLKPYDQGRAQFKSLLTQWRDFQPHDTLHAERVNTVSQLYDTWLSLSVDQTIALRKDMVGNYLDQKDFVDLFVQMSGQSIRDQIMAHLQAAQTEQVQLQAVRIQSSEKALQRLQWVSVLGGLFSAGLVLCLSWKLASSITKKLTTANLHIQALANGQLNSRIDVRGNDEVDQLLHALSKAQGNLR
ncbi:MAG TPA: CHASE3 domain-containing protein, partial [Limnobacter sp.]|nr:CHASE3 domain-containing protein [Limnobacter sp.]